MHLIVSAAGFSFKKRTKSQLCTCGPDVPVGTKSVWVTRSCLIGARCFVLTACMDLFIFINLILIGSLVKFISIEFPFQRSICNILPESDLPTLRQAKLEIQNLFVKEKKKKKNVMSLVETVRFWGSTV